MRRQTHTCVASSDRVTKSCEQRTPRDSNRWASSSDKPHSQLMTESPSHSVPALPAGIPLSRWLLILATGLLVAWCVPRVKPVLWFGPLFGGLMAMVAIGLERWFGQPSTRGQARLACLCAMLGCAAVFWVAIQAAERTNKANPKNAAAEALLRSMEWGGNLPAEEPLLPASSPSTWFGATKRYYTARYRPFAGPPGTLFVAEILSAGLLARMLYALVNRWWRPSAGAAP
jgi:hypothetical protein